MQNKTATTPANNQGAQTGTPPKPAPTPPAGGVTPLTDKQGSDKTKVDPNGTVTQTKQVGKYKVEVIRDKCISAASCVAIAPKTFQLDEENLAIILDQHGEDDQTRLLAAQSCPTAAIIVTNTETGEQVWPKA